MGRWRRTTACERAAQWISLELDGELEQLERDGLSRHIERCAGCRALELEIGAFTSLLREAPAVARESHVAASGGQRPRRRLVKRVALAGALAATLSAVGAGVFVLPSSNAGSVSALDFESTGQRLEFVHDEHIRIEPGVSFRGIVLPQSLAWRALA
jgi:anti-sigma factor RsiW